MSGGFKLRISLFATSDDGSCDGASSSSIAPPPRSRPAPGAGYRSSALAARDFEPVDRVHTHGALAARVAGAARRTIRILSDEETAAVGRVSAQAASSAALRCTVSPIWRWVRLSNQTANLDRDRFIAM
jgi:hypothetical protein